MAIIRKASPRLDHPAIFELIRTELMPLSHTVDPRDYRLQSELPHRLREGATFVIAKTHRGKPCGFVHLLQVHDTLMFDLLAVHPDHRGREFGKALMSFGEEWGCKRQCAKGILFFDEGNDRAYRLYSKLGFVLTSYNPLLRCYGMEKTFISLQ